MKIIILIVLILSVFVQGGFIQDKIDKIKNFRLSVQANQPCGPRQYATYYSGEATCHDCPDGYSCDGRDKTSCKKGTHGKHGRCLTCDDNQYAYYQFGLWNCGDCPDGYTCNGTDKKLCKFGSFGQQGNCYKCYRNQYAYTKFGINYCGDCPRNCRCDGINKNC